MRISDWSSDVCSSDLGLYHRQRREEREAEAEGHDQLAGLGGGAMEIGEGEPEERVSRTWEPGGDPADQPAERRQQEQEPKRGGDEAGDRKSTRLNSSH